MTDNSTQERHIQIEGTYNLRDIGGYLAQDKETQWSRFYRSDALHNLSSEAQKALLDLGVRTIIDLRGASELQTAPNVFAENPRVRYINVPLFNELYVTAREHADTSATKPPENLLTVYKLAVDRCQNGMRSVFESMADEDAGAVLVHCTAGKDRTGIIIALLLQLAGVPASIIAEDYAATALHIESILEDLRKGAQEQGQDMERYEQMLLAEPQAMLEFLSYVEQTYGGAEAYLLEIGITSTQIDSLRKKLVDSI